ncbi:putative adoMet-dependent methyltransferase [Hirsutella rhossiliensis]|uniref:tRNA (uracil-O(2)-)-methyltransferase n=1 Tax=Hirsutella rhossiliensis TaxID=111463 RepID=A0A9P8MZI7_9HYPO|nr:putative adoMet-dependent methyltransferase domain-containing protein [Hirsutella rhossiliensis]KAH0964172.1 putative adoMet-dependent methyltransferase domain-containing protein [Hirsutella rhossiliensis]
MLFEPEELPEASPPCFDDITLDGHDTRWVPQCRHACTFAPHLFVEKMMNLIRNPNLNSSWLFRADILFDDDDADDVNPPPSLFPPREIKDMPRQRTLVRKLIPRSERRDRPLDQTCTFHRSVPSTPSSSSSSLVIYLPHASSAADLPFYHPKVRGIAHLHEWDPVAQTGFVSVHFLPFQQPIHDVECPKLRRTAYHLLQILHKHGQSSAAGYVKRVHHDVIVPQARFQDRYASLKAKYARRLVDGWAESTDPVKHVFEDLGIAAFLMELWADMYGTHGRFPGFVDIGCGNGLLVYILRQEGYSGWGFDARARKSWAQYLTDDPDTAPESRSLQQRLLLPKVVSDSTSTSTGAEPDDAIDPQAIHDGVFPPGTFIISNHGDELTPWAPILGALSQSPFITIPCCSHNLAGAKFRAPRPRDKEKPKSTYASLVDWVSRIAEDCGWEVETEMLRIPSTRNTCLLGRRRVAGVAHEIDFDALLLKYGGVEGYADNVAKLLKSGPRSH